MSSRPLVGIAGWSYEDWRGVVYPRGCKDTLRYCAELVDFIEINNSFYRVPVAAHCESWLRRVEDLPLRFTAKLPREFTHQACAEAAVVRDTVAGFRPLVAAGRLSTLLAQFAHWFECSADNLARLTWLRDAFAETAPLTVELRHRSWASQRGQADLLGLGVGVATLDYPGADSGFVGPEVSAPGATGLAYYRIHGRNAAAWFDAKAGRDATYDYEYSASEVEELAWRSEQLGSSEAQTLVIANNHFEGKAVKLALELLARIKQTKVRVPDPLLRAYPGLRGIAAQAQGDLFA